MRKINDKLDIVEKSIGPACLITTSSTSRIYSTGFDLASLSKFTNKNDIDNFILEYQRLIGRILCFPVPTIAAINGHAFAGGCMFAMAHDYRIMRTGAGFICMNEVDLGFPLGPGTNAVVQVKLDPPTHRDMILFGKRFTAEEALSRKIIDKAVSPDNLMTEAMKLGKEIAPKGEDKENFFALKHQMYKEAYRCCFADGLGHAVKIGIKMTKPKL